MLKAYRYRDLVARFFPHGRKCLTCKDPGKRKKDPTVEECWVGCCPWKVVRAKAGYRTFDASYVIARLDGWSILRSHFVYTCLTKNPRFDIVGLRKNKISLLDLGYVIHHENGDTRCDLPSNLKLMLASEHSRQHSTGVRFDEERRRRISLANRGRTGFHWKGKFLPREIVEKFTRSKRGRLKGEENPFYGRRHTDATKLVNGFMKFGPVRTIKEIRKKHGLCPYCGYPRHPNDQCCPRKFPIKLWKEYLARKGLTIKDTPWVQRAVNGFYVIVHKRKKYNKRKFD